MTRTDGHPAESRWPPTVAVLTFGGLYAAMPAAVRVGPIWLLVTLVVALATPTWLTHWRGQIVWNKRFGHMLAATITIFMIWSLARLVSLLPQHSEPPVDLLRSAVLLWIGNVLVFAYWYWRLDAGGPHLRHQPDGTRPVAFLFPQMTLEEQSEGRLLRAQHWTPHFVDYLFLAFNTSTAFSPTDTPVLSRWAKLLTMVQASISLGVIVLLAARAVNIM